MTGFKHIIKILILKGKTHISTKNDCMRVILVISNPNKNGVKNHLKGFNIWWSQAFGQKES